MKVVHAFNVIAMLKMLATHETLLMFANLAAGAAGRHEHGHNQGDNPC